MRNYTTCFLYSLIYLYNPENTHTHTQSTSFNNIDVGITIVSNLDLLK